MKRIITLAAALFCGMCFCSAQAYQPFLVDSAHWTIEENQCIGNCDPANPPDAMDCYVTRIYTLKLGGDTIVDSFVYKKLVQNIHTTVNTGGNGPCLWPVPSEVVTCGVVGLLWEDTTARKVYIRRTNYTTSSQWHTTDSMFLDFSLQVGDTLFSQAFADTSYVVDSINYYGFNSGYPTYHLFPVKTWYLHCAQAPAFTYIANIKLYESIGASVGFWGYQPSFEGPYGSRLNSYYIGTDSAAGFSCMNPSLGIAGNTSDFFSLYPNPTKNNLTLDLNSTFDENLQFELADILGQTIFTKTVTSAKTEIDISDFSSGIYLWHLHSGGTIVRSGKVIHD